MSKRKPKAKRPTHGEQYAERIAGPWLRLPKGKVNVRALADALKREHAQLKARWNEEVIGPRSVPDDCPRAVVMPIARAADILGVEGKSDRFIARFITTGIIAANKEGRQSWKFDRDELERVARQLEDESKAARKRRSV